MKAIKKPVIVDVRGPLTSPETVKLAQGGAVIAYAGEMILTSPEGDTWPICAKVFERTYQVLDDAAISQHTGGL